MPALPFPTYSIDKLYLFPFFQTREDYAKAVGCEAPPFDGMRPPKHWFDPDAEKSTRRNIVYDTVIAYAENGGVLLDEKGHPLLESLVLVKKEAATVNIPPPFSKSSAEVLPGVPFPLRPLDPDEELIVGFGGIIQVRNKKLTADPAVGFAASDREVLRAIARKLGVPVPE